MVFPTKKYVGPKKKNTEEVLGFSLEYSTFHKPEKREKCTHSFSFPPLFVFLYFLKAK